MQQVGLVVIKDLPKRRKDCRFTDLYLEKVKEYATDIWRCTLGLPETTLLPNWVPASRAIFDFFRFKCMPEWYLLMRRILRASGLTEDGKQPIYENLFSGARMWTAINYYFFWEATPSTEKKTSSSFRASFERYSAMTEDESRSIITDLTSSRICRILNGELRINPDVLDYVNEYRREVSRDITFLMNFMSRLGVGQVTLDSEE
jgi:hypothetical protein